MSGGDGDYDLSGRWSGIFNYPSIYPPNAFEADISEIGGALSGVITQPGDALDPPGAIIQSVIEGSRESDQVRFIKIYDDLERDTVHYSGTIQPGGDEVEGTWTLPGDWSGTFMMVRARKEAAAEQRKVEDEVPVGR